MRPMNKQKGGLDQQIAAGGSSPSCNDSDETHEAVEDTAERFHF